METDAGTVNAAVLLASLTVPPPIPDRVTVQMLDPPAPKVEGAQASDVTVAALTSPIATVREAPFREAVTETVWSFGMAPAVAVNAAVAVPAATDTDAGTVSAAALPASA